MLRSGSARRVVSASADSEAASTGKSDWLWREALSVNNFVGETDISAFDRLASDVLGKVGDVGDGEEAERLEIIG